MEKNVSYWDLITGGEGVCYVCDKPVTRGIKVGLHKKTLAVLERHNHCYPGSTNWFKKFGKRIWTKE